MAKKKKEQVFQSTFTIYRYVGNIGSGGSGIVVRVEDENKDTFALKYLSPDRISGEKIKRFKNELNFCEKNEHKNIIKVLDHGYIEQKGKKCPFYVMKYYPETLRTIMQKGIPPISVLPFFSQILDGIEAAHLYKIWHRDIKPENILFDSSKNTLLIADFGIAHFGEEFLHTSVLTQARERLANFQYAAPEQRILGVTVDNRADIYALGMILNEMFTGKQPHGTKFQRIGEVSPEHAYLDDLIDLMLSQNPDQRPKDIDSIKKALIAHKNVFVSEQKLSQLKNTVVLKYESDDPLVNNPVSLVNVDYKTGNVIFKLNQKVNSDWIEIFKNPRGSYTSLMGYEPESFYVQSDQVIVVLRDENIAKDIVAYFKTYLEKANQGYKDFIQRQQQKEADEKRQLEIKIAEEQKRQRILKNIKI
jgi:serine/threonine protein kinase